VQGLLHLQHTPGAFSMEGTQASIHGVSSRPAIPGRAFAGARQCRANSPLSLRFSADQGSAECASCARVGLAAIHGRDRLRRPGT
jgi:hypothetical protein